MSETERFIDDLEAEIVDLRVKLEAAEEAKRRLQGAAVKDIARIGLREAELENKLEAAEGEAERIMAANDVPELYGAGQRRAAERILGILIRETPA